jgi:hypothetical protein
LPLQLATLRQAQPAPANRLPAACAERVDHIPISSRRRKEAEAWNVALQYSSSRIK